MDKTELNLILKEGEGYKIEFKEGIGSIDKEIVAFANSSGGRIFVGVTDEGVIRKIFVNNKLKSRIQDIANNCRPKIKIFLEEFNDILIINVREGDDKPYECSSGYYKRIGPNSQKMTRDEILEIFKSEGKVRFDELIEPKFEYPRDFDRNKLVRYLELAGLSKSTKAEIALVNLGVAEKQEGKLLFNKAGVLFFAKEPQRFISWSVYTVALFKNDAGTDVIDRKEIEGGLFEIVEEVMKFVKLYAKVAYRFTGMPQRENIYEYPFEAIREAVINSVMHKYYFEHGHNNILRFLPERIRIENYWLKPYNFKLGETVFRRNQITADLFARIHFGEKMGTGFERIREICKNENAPFPEIEYNENYFYTTFRQCNMYLEMAPKELKKTITESITVKDTVNITVKITETQKKLLDEIGKDKFITAKKLSALIGISERNIKANIKKLKKEKLLKRIGSDKSGYWEILQK